MHALRTLALVTGLASAGCAAHTGGAPAPPAAAPRPAILDEVPAALRRGDIEGAAAIIERARRAEHRAGPPHARLAYYDATVHVYRGDYPGALGVMADHIARVGPADRAAFNFHDAMIALRTAGGDLLGALVECDEMVLAGSQGSWTEPGSDRMTLVRLKQHWHRAYLLRMVAETRDGAERTAFLGYAEAARQAYTALAAPLPDAADSIAVLDAYFAFCDGDPARMAAAARRVHTDQDDDLEDLYLVQLALDGAGDHAAAAALQARMTSLDQINVLAPIFLGWLRSDAAPGEPAFSPRHPAAARRAR